MKTLLVLCVLVMGCQTPAVKNAEKAGETTAEACLKVNIWQPIEKDGISLVAKIGAALLTGGGQTALDQGEAQVKAELQSLPSTIEPLAIDCAAKTAVAIFDAATMVKTFAGGPDIRVITAATIGRRILIQRGASSQ